MFKRLNFGVKLLMLCGLVLCLGKLQAQSFQQSAQLWDIHAPQYIQNVPRSLNPNQSFTDFGGPGFPVVNDSIGHRITAEALLLGRSDIGGPAFVFDDNGPSLSYSDLTFNLETGYRVGVGFFTNDNSGFEMTYFNQQNSFTNVQNGPNVIPVFFGGIPATPDPSYDVVYDTDLDSFEMNYWVRSGPIGRFGIGGRYIQLKEQFDIVESGAALRSGFFDTTQNEMWGVQFLCDQRRNLGQGFVFTAGLKAGGFGNDVDLFADTENADLSRTDDAFSFALDFWAGFELQMNSVTQLRFGYQGLLLNNVALAPLQSEVLDIFNPTAGDIALDSVTYNGVYAGVSMSF